MEKFLENLGEAERITLAMDHLIYVTFPIVKDKRMLLKILIETKKAVALCINSILQYDYLYKRVSLHKKPAENFLTFREKCAPRYGITKEEVGKISLLFDIAEKHRQSPLEFVKENKIVIMSESLHSETITVEKLKEFIILAKNLIGKVKNFMKTNYY